MHPCIQNNDFEIGNEEVQSRILGGPFREPPLRIRTNGTPVILIVQFPRFSSKWMDHHALASRSPRFSFNPPLSWLRVNPLLLSRAKKGKENVLHVYNFVPNERRMINFQGILKYRFDAFSLLNLEIYKWRWYIRILLVSISICWFILWRCSFHWFILLSIFYSSFSSIYCHDF